MRFRFPDWPGGLADGVAVWLPAVVAVAAGLVGVAWILGRAVRGG